MSLGAAGVRVLCLALLFVTTGCRRAPAGVRLRYTPQVGHTYR
jgi:hypothetical protein